MASKSRGGLSKREVARLGGTKVSSDSQAKKSASSSIKKEEKSLMKAQKSYLKTLNPSKEEEAALKANNDILMKYETTAKDVQDPTKNAVAGVFVDRQLDRLGADTDAKTIPLKYQITALQNAREAKSKAASEKVSFASKRYNDKVSSFKTENPLDTEYKQIRNDKARIQLDKAGSRGTSSGLDKTTKSLIKSAQERIISGKSNREDEQANILSKTGKSLGAQDILKDGYKVLKSTKSSKRSVN